jgi:hypothetical protein
LAAVPPAGSVILKNGNGLIRPVRGFPRRTGLVMAPASGAGGIGSQVWPAAFDGSGLCAFAAPSTCMGPPLTESPGRCQVHERGRRAAEPIRASTTTRRAAHEWRPGARTDGETLCTASGAGTAWARSAARFRSARRDGRWAAAFSSAKGNQRPRPRGSRPAGLRARPQWAGNDCDASSLQRSRP